MTQNDFEFLRSALLGKCDGLLREIVENDKLRKLAEQKAEEQDLFHRCPKDGDNGHPPSARNDR
jgi:hypothetical protein